MSRNVRNFWIEGTIDGRNTDIGTGPVSKDGGFHLVIRMMDQGKITDPLYISGSAGADGELTLHVGDGKGQNFKTIKTRRDAPKRP